MNQHLCLSSVIEHDIDLTVAGNDVEIEDLSSGGTVAIATVLTISTAASFES